MNKLVSAYMVYQFIRLLVTPFEKTDAFKLGIIDKNGKYLKKQRELLTTDEKKASTLFHRLVFNIKKLLAKVPGGQSRLGTFAAALYLIKEEVEKVGCDGKFIDEAFLEYVKHYHDDEFYNELRESLDVRM
jgi:hypothetical protein|tara:strand:+ start:6426 stop:6818 length:393 start_codon:yes stop_codon:yes gene_type:complete